jgi:hypothetical protein
LWRGKWKKGEEGLLNSKMAVAGYIESWINYKDDISAISLGSEVAQHDI